MKPREYILNTLYHVFKDQGYASLILRDAKDLSPMEMPFVSECVYGTIRNYAYLESQWRPYVKHVTLRTSLLLDEAVYQMFFMKNPDYAVINETVELAERGQKDFVNAVLHQVQKNGEIKTDSLPLNTSHPEWILQMWKAHYGEETMQKIAEHDQKRPTVYGRVNTLKCDPSVLMKDEHYHFIDDVMFTCDKPIQNTEEFKNGMTLIQNRSSQEAVKAMHLKDNLTVLDVCSAPGTKTQMMACLMHNTGHITGCDLYEHRCTLIEDLMKRTGTKNTEVLIKDGCKEDNFKENSFDRILCDVPCSGLGDLSHKPEIKWHLKPEDIDALVKTQASILKTASKYLKEDGILVYSTCTLNKKENEKQIEKFLKEHDDFALLKERTIFPFEEDGDGFYIAEVSKKSSGMVE